MKYTPTTYHQLAAVMPIQFAAGIEAENRRRETRAKAARELQERNRKYWRDLQEEVCCHE